MSEDVAYPLADHAVDRLHAKSGRPLGTITDEAAAAGELVLDDLQISAETLQTQAALARRAGYPQLAANLMRAAELTAVPNDEVLQMYETLRPRRASYAELQELADRLEQVHNARENAALVREAAEVYQARNLLRQ